MVCARPLYKPGVGGQHPRLRAVFGLNHLRHSQRAGDAADFAAVIVGHQRAGERRRVFELPAGRAFFGLCFALAGLDHQHHIVLTISPDDA